MKMEIISAGPLSTVQDKGRFGYLEYGIGQSGVMDRDAFQKANALVGNRDNEAVIEATLLGPAFRFDKDTLIACMGADMQGRSETDGRIVERGRAFPVRAGETVRFGMAKCGVRGYIAVAGGIDVPVVMGSRSTDCKCRIGGYEGRKLKDGDGLSVFDADLSEKARKRLLKKSFSPLQYGADIVLRVIPGPQIGYFTERGIQTFLETAYEVTSESDRMGIRLRGPVIEGKGGMDIVSDGITFGSIQVTSAGLPIILAADHQTTGGYAQIAVVAGRDLPYLAQARPGDRIHFQKAAIEDVQRERKNRWYRW